MASIPSRGGSPRLNREINKALVISAIRQHGPISRAHLARTTGINPNTISVIVDGFIGTAMVREIGEAPSGGGRPSMLVEINAAGHYVVGIEIGERSVRGTLVDFAGNAITSVSNQLSGMQPEMVIKKAQEAVMGLCEQKGISPRTLLGVGIAVPGVISPDRRRVLHSVPLGWSNVPLGDELATALSLRIEMLNNSLAISTYYSHFHTGARPESILIFIITFHPLPHTGMTNLGCGIVLNGEAYAGRYHMAGEIAVGVPHPLTSAKAAGWAGTVRMQDLLKKSDGVKADAGGEVWATFCRDLTQIVSRSVDLITPDLTLICSDLPELRHLIGEKFSRQIAASTVMGTVSSLESGPEPPRVEFETLRLTAAAHGAALPFLAEFERMPEIGNQGNARSWRSAQTSGAT